MKRRIWFIGGGVALFVAAALWWFGGDALGLLRFKQEFAAAAADRGREPALALADACVPCHGSKGNSIADAYPPLAGQSAVYLSSQLTQFASGQRWAPAMESMARSLSTRDRDVLVQWFARQTPTVARIDALPETLRSCAACHGDHLEGRNGPLGAPRLAGLGKIYVTAQLLAFRSRKRGTTNGPMNVIAQPLSDAAIAELGEAVASARQQLRANAK